MNDFQSPKWSKPNPLGFGAEVGTTTSIATPLLAGFSIILIGAIMPSQQSFRWPGTTVLLLAVSSTCLISSLQCGLIAQRHLTSRADDESWWTTGEIRERQTEFSHDQEHDLAVWLLWAAWATAFFYAGIAVFAAGLATMLAPLPCAHGTLHWTRMASAALLALGSLFEIAYGAYTTSSAFTAYWGRRPLRKRKQSTQK